MTCGGGGCEESGSSPKRVSQGAVLEWEDPGLWAHVTRGTALVRGAFLGEDALVLAAASGVGRAHGGAGVGSIARLRGGSVEGFGGVGLAVAVADDGDTVVKVIHTVTAGVVLVPAGATPRETRKR